MIGKIEVATDHDGGTRLARQRADDIPGILVDSLLFRRAPCVTEKIPDGGLALSASHGAAFEAILHQRRNNQVYFQLFG
jgi:hypothetical protein